MRNRIHGTSNSFSEGHRINLPSNCYMVDVDGVYLDVYKNEPTIILEDKYNFVSKYKLSNPLEKQNWQRKSLLYFCNKLGIHLVLNEISSDSWYYIDNNDNIQKNYKIKAQLEKYRLVKTENSLYLEVRNNKVISVMYLKDSIEMPILKKISERFPIFSIDIQGGIINIYRASLSWKIETSEDWVKVYKQLELL